MDYEIICQPSFSLLEVTLKPGERIVAEAGAMAWMEGPLKTETSTRGGVLSGLKRAVLSGESFFQNTYSAEGGPAKVGLASGVAGDIVPYQMSGGELFLERGAVSGLHRRSTVRQQIPGTQRPVQRGAVRAACHGNRDAVFRCLRSRRRDSGAGRLHGR